MPRKALRCGLQLELRSELYHSPENFAEVAGVGGFIRPGPIIQNKHCHRHQYLMLGGTHEMPPTGADPGSVQWEIAQITCPGVLLKDKQELYLNVFVLGQYSKTECVPAVFPLFFQERLVFEKEFANIVDPGDLVKLLECTFWFFVYYVADTNLLDSTLNGKMQSKVPKKSPPPAEKGRQSSAVKGYEQPTIASKSRSPSPYTKRRMCELSEEARQRLAHLNLGPHEFRRDTDKPPFVIRRVGQPSPGAKLHPWCSPRESTVEAWPKASHDPSLLDSYRPKKTEAKSTSGKGLDSSAICKEDLSLDPRNREFHSAASLEHSAPPAAQEPSPSRTSLSSVLNRSSLRERFSTVWPSPTNGDEIHKRVKNILRTHSARQRLIFDDLPQTRELSDNVPLTVSELRSSPRVKQNPPVDLDNGECWSVPAAVYKEKPHRAILEETLAKIYKDMYQKTAGAVPEHKTHS
ncbi:spermatogenesis-associated protein 6 isoform X2 [Turdus rufiventris]|nr:spermatogenesis-associated protein 6 isoform X2 [Turdus rufiventris]